MKMKHERHAQKIAEVMHSYFMDNCLDYVRDVTTMKDGYDSLDEYFKVEEYATTLFAIKLLKEIHNYE
jgi:hypothetical protein